MNFLSVCFLGLLQGLTEFLPVSSSGHLVIFQALLNIESPGIFLELALHLATLFAVMVAYRQDVLALIKEGFAFLGDLIHLRFKEAFDTRAENRRLLLLIAAASVPTAILGIGLEDVFERFYDSLLMVGIFLLITGLVLRRTAHVEDGRVALHDIGFKRALLIGTVQGFAIAPGISRSGSTISAGLFTGIKKDDAARFSFLLSLPAVVGSVIFKVKDVFTEGAMVLNLATLASMVIAFVVGILSIYFLVALLKKDRFGNFGYYCLGAGLVSIILHFVL